MVVGRMVVAALNSSLSRVALLQSEFVSFCIQCTAVILVSPITLALRIPFTFLLCQIPIYCMSCLPLGLFSCSESTVRGFPGGAVVKNPPANAGDMGLSPGPGRSHMPRSN